MKSVGVQGLLAATASIAILMATPVCAAPEQSREYHIAAQDLGAALRALGQASGGEILFAADTVAGKRSAALDGSYTLKGAVDELLSGSGLIATERNGSILIRGRSSPPEGAAEETADSDIVVTGTRLRGAPVASTVIAVTRKDMADSGQSSLAAVIRDIPQNFNGGQNPGVGFGVPESNGINVGSGTSLNLRGLGSDATLTLLDGHRLAYNLNYNAVDVSTIPFEAVDRLEVVPDGSSALYGSDAVAGVVNIVLKDRFDGVRASARLGSSTEGGAFQQQYSVIAGTDWKSGGLYAAYEFGKDTPVTAEDRAFLQGRQPGLMLLPSIKHHSAMIKGVQDLGSGFEFQAEALYDKRWSERSYALNPAGDYRVSGQIFKYETESFVVAPSLKFDPGADWRIVLTGMYGLNRQFYDGKQYANSAPIFPTQGCYCNKANSIELVADGPLAHLPAGAMKLAIGGGYRKNLLHAYRTLGTAQDFQVSQTAYYAFGELGVPVISDEQRSFLRSLSLSAAMRYESYPGIDQVATPKLGLVAALTADVTLKASWGKSFKAPTLFQQYNSSFSYLFNAATLGQAGAPAGSGAILLTGGNPDLKPERATTWSTTLDLHPAWADGARLELSYFHIDYRDRVVTPINFLTQSLSNPIYADLVTRSPSAAEVAAAVARGQTFINVTSGALDPANVIAIVDDTSTNAASQTIEGLDLLGQYAFDVSSGTTARLVFNGSYLDSSQRLSALQPETQLAGILFNPPKWRVRGGAIIEHGGFNLSAFVNYMAGVSDTRRPVTVHVDPMTTADLTARYSIEPGASPIGGIDISLTVTNLFDAHPELIATSSGMESPYDSTNYSPLGRFISLSIAKSW
jgi:outer membrane receptor protein involved in Fe transport